jgi:hypothetical protein
VGKRLYRPRPATVELGAGGVPVAVGGREVESILEQWLVEDRWWNGRPLRRSYFQLTTVDGADAIVFCDLVSGRWYSQRGA